MRKKKTMMMMIHGDDAGSDGSLIYPHTSLFCSILIRLFEVIPLESVVAIRVTGRAVADGRIVFENCRKCFVPFLQTIFLSNYHKKDE